VHYNNGTGCDLKHHYQYPQTHLFQTHVIIDKVPAKSLLSEKEWNNHYLQLNHEKDMDLAYQWIENHIGKGGFRLPASENQEDYEAPQFSGTCTVQSKMALIRHLIMQITNGTPAEKEACYKLIKTYLYLQYLKENENKFDDYIKQYIPLIREKLSAEETLIQIARDEMLMNESMAVFKSVQVDFNLNEEIIVPPSHHTFLSRYAILRRNSSLIFKNILSHQKQIPIELSKHPALKLIMAKISNYECIKKNINVLMNSNIDKSDQVFTIITQTPYVNIAITEFLNYLGKESETKEMKINVLEKFFNTLKHDYKKNDFIANKIFNGLNMQENSELADHALTYWEKIKNQLDKDKDKEVRR
jgi:hypothetical protein